MLRASRAERITRAEDDLPDAVLVRRVQTADSSDALAALYRRHRAMVYGVAYRFLATEEDAQDIVQDVFAALPEALLRTYQEQDRFEFWLKRLAVRAALMSIRGRSRRREGPLLHMAELLRTAAADPDVVTELVATRRALAQLSDEQRTVLLLKQVEGYSHAEISRMLGISEGASGRSGGYSVAISTSSISKATWPATSPPTSGAASFATSRNAPAAGAASSGFDRCPNGWKRPRVPPVRCRGTSRNRSWRGPTPEAGSVSPWMTGRRASVGRAFGASAARRLRWRP